MAMLLRGIDLLTPKICLMPRLAPRHIPKAWNWKTRQDGAKVFKPVKTLEKHR